jgi:hypothetical protein
MLKRLLAVITLLCIILSVLTACGGTASNKDGGSRSEIDKAIDDLDKLEEETGVKVDDGIKDLLEDIDEADLDAAAAANDDVKAVADLPEGWEIDEDSPLLLSANKVTRLLSVTGANIPYDAGTITEYAEQTRAQMKEYFEDATISDVESIKLGNYDGARYIFDYAITKSMVQRQVYFFFYEGKKVFMVQGAYMMDDEGAAEEVEAVMASVRIEKR